MSHRLWWAGIGRKGEGGSCGEMRGLGGTASAVCGRGVGLGTRTGCTPTALGAAPPPRRVGDTSSDGPGGRRELVRVTSPLLLLPSSPPPASSVGVVVEGGPLVGTGGDRRRPRLCPPRGRGRIPPSRTVPGIGWGIGIPPRMVVVQMKPQLLKLAAEGGNLVFHPLDLRVQGRPSPASHRRPFGALGTGCLIALHTLRAGGSGWIHGWWKGTPTAEPLRQARRTPWGTGPGQVPLRWLPCGWGWRGTGSAQPAPRLKVEVPRPGGAAPGADWGLTPLLLLVAAWWLAAGSWIARLADPGALVPVVRPALPCGGACGGVRLLAGRGLIQPRLDLLAALRAA